MKIIYILTAIILILIIIYIRYYLKYKTDIKILQVFINNFKLDNLYERYPLLIYDQIYSHKELLDTIFAYSYQFTSETKVINPEIAKINKSKYLLISPVKDDIILNIINPKYAEEVKKQQKFSESNIQYVSIKLKAKQVLILPSRWIFQSDQEIMITKLDDILSVIAFNLFV